MFGGDLHKLDIPLIYTWLHEEKRSVFLEDLKCNYVKTVGMRTKKNQQFVNDAAR